MGGQQQSESDVHGSLLTTSLRGTLEVCSGGVCGALIGCFPPHRLAFRSGCGSEKAPDGSICASRVHGDAVTVSAHLTLHKRWGVGRIGTAAWVFSVRMCAVAEILLRV